MASFKDSKGREWCFPEITEGTIIAVRREIGIDWHLVIDRNEAELAKAFSASGVANLIWFLLASECEKRGVDQEDFASAMNHTAREAATRALMDAFLSFYHGPVNGPEMAKTLMSVTQSQTKQAVQALKKQYGDSPASSA